MQVGMWLGYVSFGFIGDALGRKRSYIIYLLAAAVLIVSYTSTRNATVLLALGPLVAFFGTGYFSGFGAITAEIYPTEIRATAQGFTFNVARRKRLRPVHRRVAGTDQRVCDRLSDHGGRVPAGGSDVVLDSGN